MTRLTGIMAALAMTAACASAPFPASAQIMESAPVTTPTIQQETTLSLSGEGKTARAPDIAMISVGVSIDADTASAAMKEQAKRMNGVFAALKKAGVANKDMQTGNISLSPRYDYSSRKNGEPPRLVGYNASNQLNIKIRKLDSLGTALDSVVSAGGNTINSVSFGLDDPADALKEARKNAVQDALEKAELYATAAGYKVSRIITIDEGGGGDYYPQPMMVARAEMASDAPTPVAAGEVNYSANVNVTFELTR